MIQLLAKVVIWLIVGAVLVAVAVPRTGIRAASPWQFAVEATGSVSSITEIVDHNDGGTPFDVSDDSMVSSSDVFVKKSEAQIAKTFDLGVISFALIMFGGGSGLMYLLKPRFLKP